MKQVEKQFSGILNETQKIERNKFFKKQLVKNAVSTFVDDVPTSAVFVGFHCEGFKKNYSSSADIIANILGSGRSSRLYKHLIYETQVASEVGAYVDKREESSLLILYAFANNSKTTADELYESIKECVDELVEGKIDDKEIEKANNQLYSQFAFEIDSFTGIADLIAIHTLFHNEPEKIFSTIETYGNFTRNDITKAVKQIFKKDTGIRIDAIPKK
jgi:predicted Zn-dependent peptidase